MTDATPAGQSPATPPPAADQGTGEQPPATRPAGPGPVTTVLMAVAVAAAVVVLLDIATRGRVLGPLFAAFGGRSAAPPPADPPPPASE
jgi:hypothetical protein